MSANQKDCDRFLPLRQFALNSTQSSTTGYSPAVVISGREPTLPMEHDVRAITDDQVQSVTNRLDRMTAINKTVQASVTKASEWLRMPIDIVAF